MNKFYNLGAWFHGIPTLRIAVSRCEKKMSLGFPTKSDTNGTAQPQEMARGLQFQI